MKHLFTLSKSAAAGLVLMAASQAWAQTPGGAPADVPTNARKGTISQPVQPSVKPQVQTSTLPKITKTWNQYRHPKKTVTGTITPVAPAPVPQPHAAPQPGHGKCPPGLAKKNNGCLPPGHAK